MTEPTNIPTGKGTLYSRFSNQPALMVWGLILVQLFLWTLIPTLVNRNLPLDVIELVTWGHEWQWGYFKHPPLPSWLLEVGTWLAGSSAWPAYLLSQVSIVIAFWAIWRLGCLVISAQAAALSVFLTSLIYFYNFPTPEFNHNILQIPVWALMVLVGWHALQSDRLWQWLLLGFQTGISLYIKYSMAILVFALLVYLFIEPAARQRLRSKGLWLAIMLALIMAIPHLWWLIAHDFQPLLYASGRSKALAGLSEHILGPLLFLAAQLGHHGGLLLVLLLGGALLPFGRKHGVVPECFSFSSDRAKRYVLWIAIAPFLITIVLSILAGTEMRPMWPAPMFSFTALALLGHVASCLFQRALSIHGHWMGDTLFRHIVGGCQHGVVWILFYQKAVASGLAGCCYRRSF